MGDWSGDLPRRIFVDCDYSASPLWDANDPGMCFDPRMFDLSEDLAQRLEDWARAWDRRAWALLDAELDEDEDEDDDEEDRPPDPEDLEHEREGIALWLALRAELAGRHEVGYRAWAGHREDAHGGLLVVWTCDEYERSRRTPTLERALP